MYRAALSIQEKGNIMSLKLKVLGLGLLAVMATSAFAVMNASATVTGHFTHDAAGGHATIVGTENFSEPKHITEFHRTATTGGEYTGAAITCTKTTYHGTVATATTQELTITPDYTECGTTGGTWNEVTVTMNNCDYTFKSNTAASASPPTADATVTIDCPVGSSIEIHHPNCTIIVPAQTPKGGVSYTRIIENNKHAITVDVTATHIVGYFHGGACIFLGTTKEFDMTGGATVKGTTTTGEQVNITAT